MNELFLITLKSFLKKPMVYYTKRNVVSGKPERAADKTADFRTNKVLQARHETDGSETESDAEISTEKFQNSGILYKWSSASKVQSR